MLEETPGLRERKKLRTRKTLVDTAIRMFDEKGYEQTNVAEIAAAAEVSTKTFFNYFPSKEAVIFADSDLRAELALRVISERRPNEEISELLVRVVETLIDQMVSSGMFISEDLIPIRTRLAMTVPSLRGRALHMMFDIQRQVAEALCKAYPDRLDPITAAAVVGALLGAAQAAALASLELEGGERFNLDSAKRGFDVAMNGIRSVDTHSRKKGSTDAKARKPGKRG